MDLKVLRKLTSRKKSTELLKMNNSMVKEVRDKLLKEFDIFIENGEIIKRSEVSILEVQSQIETLRIEDNILLIVGHHFKYTSIICDMLKRSIHKAVMKTLHSFYKSEFNRIKSVVIAIPEIYDTAGLEVPKEIKDLAAEGYKQVNTVFKTSVEAMLHLRQVTITGCLKLYNYHHETKIKVTGIEDPVLLLSTLLKTSPNFKFIDSVTKCLKLYKSKVKVIMKAENTKSQIQPLPKGNYLVIADKLIGLCITTVAWQHKAYLEQIEAGQSEKIDLTEEEVLKKLEDDITEFLASLTSEETVIYNKYCGLKPLNPRVPILNCIPKVAKMSKFDSEYLRAHWAELPARPIRSGSSDPLNSAAQCLKLLLDKLLELSLIHI